MLNRRGFLQSTALTGAAAWLASSRARAGKTPGAALKGFIVSDAHFGWENTQQPAPEVQREMMQRILRRFPNLDVFFDTGDVHHGSAHGEQGELARAQWTETILEAGFSCPFHYVMGNHDGMSAHDEDSEWRCARLGSLACRPYYSFNLAGIHFVSLPQLMRTVYVNRESLEWLRLDLDVHKNMTTVVLSHNNFIGATGPFEEGYRGMVNGDAVQGILDGHGKVLAWMHGHNHNYQVVKQNGRLHVSNGRIGGFDPSRKEADGPYGLGGIYFEVDADGLLVRGWSAEREDFLDNLGIAGTHGALDSATSFDPAAAPQFCHGMGGARDGMRVPVYHHMAGGARTAFLREESSPVFNDDPDIALYMARHNDKSRPPHKQLMGSDVLGRPDWAFSGPGLLMRPASGSEPITLTMPQRGMGEACYYPAAPGAALSLIVGFTTAQGGWTMSAEALCYDRNKRELAAVPLGARALAAGGVRECFEVTVPDVAENTIYADAASDNVVHVMFRLEFRGTGEGTLNMAGLRQTSGAGKAGAPALIVAGQRYPGSGEGIATAALPPASEAREVVEVSSAARVTWLIRVDAADVQVLNAPVVLRNGRYAVGPLRNPWSRRGIIRVNAAPLPGMGHVAVELRGVNRAEIAPLTDGLDLVLTEAGEAEAVLRFIGDGPWPRVVGGAEAAWSGAAVRLQRSGPGVVTLRRG